MNLSFHDQLLLNWHIIEGEHHPPVEVSIAIQWSIEISRENKLNVNTVHSEKELVEVIIIFRESSYWHAKECVFINFVWSS